MPAVSGTFSAVGVSASSVCTVDGDFAYSFTGTFVATLTVERAIAGSSLSWEVVAGPFTGANTGGVKTRAGDILRVRCIKYTSGTATYSGTPEVAATSGPFPTSGPRWFVGTGTPEAHVQGSPGDLYSNKSGGTSTTLYVKETGVGTLTGWVAK